MNSSILRCRKPISRRAAVLLSTLFPLILLSAHAQIVVNSTGDGSNGYPPGFGGCDTNAFDNVIVCTLRAAIEVANGNPNVSTITFNIPTTDPGYNAQTHSWTINLGSALPDLSTNMNINGPGASKLVVRRSNATATPSFRIFNVTTLGPVSFSGLTISNGLAVAGQAGGGVQNANRGTINFANCTLRDNVSDVYGGAISSEQGGTVNVANSTLEFNWANGPDYGYGGAILVYGEINVSDSTFLHNTSSQWGGAIYAQALATIVRSTFSENIGPLGGAIYTEGGDMSIANSTFYANSAGYERGGAIFVNNALGGTLDLSNCTVTANFSGVGGSVYSWGDNGSGHPIVTVKSTIIAGNYGGTFDGGAAPDVYGPFVSQGFNLIGKKDGSTGFTAATDKKGTAAAPLNPGLDWKGLRNNGGPTQTVALLPGSAAIDKGTSASLAGTLTTDQRGTGFLRTVDKAAVNATGGDGTDIGAFELQ